MRLELEQRTDRVTLVPLARAARELLARVDRNGGRRATDRHRPLNRLHAWINPYDARLEARFKRRPFPLRLLAAFGRLVPSVLLLGLGLLL